MVETLVSIAGIAENHLPKLPAIGTDTTFGTPHRKKFTSGLSILQRSGNDREKLVHL